MMVVTTHIGDMPAALSAADIVVSASTDAEASAAFRRSRSDGRPVIATTMAARARLCSRESPVLLVKPNSGTAIAEALLELFAKTPQELPAMGRQGASPYRSLLHG